MTKRDNRDYIRVLLSSYCITITGAGVLLIHGTYPKTPLGLGFRAPRVRALGAEVLDRRMQVQEP